MGEEGAAIVENERGSGSPKRKSVSPKRDEAEGGASPKRKSVSPKRSSVSPKRAESPEKKVDLETQVRNHKDAITMEGADASDILGALEGLYALDITVDLLRSTMIGKAVNQMVKASEDAEVKAKAKELVMKWKNQSGVPIKRKPSNDIPVNDQMAKRLRGMGNAPKKATHAPSPAAASGGRAPSPKKPVAAVQDLTKVMDVKLTGIRQRDMVRSKLFTSLRPREDEEDKEPAELAVQIELAMQKHLWPSSREAMKDESKAYMDQVRAVIFNLKDKKNLTFRKRVLVGAIQAQDLPSKFSSSQNYLSLISKSNSEFWNHFKHFSK